jgi:hypothetical protein
MDTTYCHPNDGKPEHMSAYITHSFILYTQGHILCIYVYYFSFYVFINAILIL